MPRSARTQTPFGGRSRVVHRKQYVRSQNKMSSSMDSEETPYRKRRKIYIPIHYAVGAEHRAVERPWGRYRGNQTTAKRAIAAY